LYEAEQRRKKKGSQGLLAEVGEPLSYAPGATGLLGNALLGAQYLTGERTPEEGASALAMMTGLLQGTKVAPIMRAGKAMAKTRYESELDAASDPYILSARKFIKEGGWKRKQDAIDGILDSRGLGDDTLSYALKETINSSGTSRRIEDIVADAMRLGDKFMVEDGMKPIYGIPGK
jgi:hypothetical protein